jgi:hypothetical protein
LHGATRTVTLSSTSLAAASQSDEVAEASERAIQTSGKSAVSDVLGEDEPPWRLVLTSDGIRRDDY